MIDAITLLAVADELNEKIQYGRVQDIVQLDALSFGFEIYAHQRRQYLFVSAHPVQARIHLVSQKLRGSGDPSTSLRRPSAFLSLLRKYGEGALLDSIAPLPNERVLKIQLDHSEQGVSTLVIETIGRYSNIILVDADGNVMDAVKRVPAAINRTRVILPKHPYLPPPPQVKLDPATLDTSHLSRVLAQRIDTPLWRILVDTIAGVSPLLAQEVEYRVIASEAKQSPKSNEETVCTASVASSQSALLAMTIATLQQLSHAPWQPSVASEDDEPAAFAPYALMHFPNTRPFESISAAIEAFYGEQDAYASVKETLRAQIAEARDKLARKRDSLERSVPREEEIERLRTSGEMILAYASQIKKGQERLKAEGTGVIPLNPHLSAVENAQKYFKEYKRAKDARARVPALLTAAKMEVEYAEQMLNDLELAETREEIDVVVQAAREDGLIKKVRIKKKIVVSEPRAFPSRDGFTILVGKNARQNEEITFRRAKPDDLWLHARQVAGAHVVILSGGREIPESTIKEAARLAAQFSQARDDSHVDVIVTERRNVRRARGGKPGMVTVRNERVITVASN